MKKWTRPSRFFLPLNITSSHCKDIFGSGNVPHARGDVQNLLYDQTFKGMKSEFSTFYSPPSVKPNLYKLFRSTLSTYTYIIVKNNLGYHQGLYIQSRLKIVVKMKIAINIKYETSIFYKILYFLFCFYFSKTEPDFEIQLICNVIGVLKRLTDPGIEKGLFGNSNSCHELVYIHFRK